MISRTIIVTAMAGALAALLLARGKQQQRVATKRDRSEDLSRWEDEGGNVPSVVTPTPVPAFSNPS